MVKPIGFLIALAGVTTAYIWWYEHAIPVLLASLAVALPPLVLQGIRSRRRRRRDVKKFIQGRDD